MIRRAALVGLMLVLFGSAAIFAAAQLGVSLPWDIVTGDHESAPNSTSNNRDPGTAPADETGQASQSPADVVRETTAALEGLTAAGAKPGPGSVALDIQRISPDGLSVFAGRAEPDTYVTVLENGKPAGSVKADSDGSWSLATEHKFASADPKLSFETSSTPPAALGAKDGATAEARPVGPPPAKTADSAAAANDVLRKFENLVSEAREAALKAGQSSKTGEASSPTATATPDSRSPDSQSSEVSRSSETGSGASSTTTVTAANAGGSATSSAPAAATANATRQASIPVPIMFVYNEAKLTPEGQRAADLLLEYLTLKHLSAVELTGHADERGTTGYNFDLSRDRLDTVSRILKQGGYGGELTLVPKGETEPYEGVDRNNYRGEALFQLDRRVELRIIR